MKLDEGLVRHVARLARLALTDEEVGEVVPQLARILAHVEQVSGIDCDDDPATQPPIGVEALREDVEGETLARPDLIRNAPAHDGAFLVVPRFFEED